MTYTRTSERVILLSLAVEEIALTTLGSLGNKNPQAPNMESIFHEGMYRGGAARTAGSIA